MLPLIGLPYTIKQGFEPEKGVFPRPSEYRHVSHYLTGLLLSPNKTRQGIHSQFVFEDEAASRRRVMQEAVMAGQWTPENMMSQHRQVVGQRH